MPKFSTYADYRSHLQAKENKMIKKLIEVNNISRTKLIHFLQKHGLQVLKSESNDNIIKRISSWSYSYIVNWFEDRANIAQVDKDMINAAYNNPQERIKDVDFNYIRFNLKDVLKNYVLKMLSYIGDIINDRNIYALLKIKFISINVETGNQQYLTKTYILNMDHYDDVINKIKINMSNKVTPDDPTDSKNFIAGSILENKILYLDLAYIKKTRLRNHGAMFKYVLKTDKIDLSRYQIYNKVDDIDPMPCLAYALLMGGLEKEEVNKIIEKFFIGHREIIAIDKLKNVCEFSKIHITLHYRLPGGKKTMLKYGNEEHKNFIIGLIDDHYFIYDNTNYSIYSIENYFEIKDIEDFNKITGEKIDKEGKKKYIRQNDRQNVLSFKIIEYLLFDLNLDPKYMSPLIDTLDIKKKKIIKNNVDIIKSIDKKPMIYEERRPLKDEHIIFLDFEATTKGEHKPYMIKATKILIHDDYIEILYNDIYIGDKCASDFLFNFINNDCVLIAHNLKYDFSFLVNYMCKLGLIERNNSLMGGVCTYYNPILKKPFSLYLRDSYKHLSYPLKKFGDIFKLNVKKEVMPYSIYTEETINKKYHDIDDALKYFKDDKDKKEFLKNIDLWDLKNKNNDKQFNHIKYSQKYCELDVKVLMRGYMIYRNWMLEICDLDVLDYPTISGLAHDYLLKNGVYEGCYSFNGDVKKFLNNFIVGGRTMTKLNKKYIVKKILNDLDGVSLYPSAMSMLAYLKGTPEIIKEGTTYDDIKNYDGYFIKINITKINKKLNFPMLSKKNEDGTRIFKDEIGDYYVDKIMLEDLIRHQKIEFTIICGIYFNNGRNDKIKEVITFLFNERLRYKREGNPIQESFKLIMNSSYGKLILKDVDTENKYIKGENNMLQFVLYNLFNVNDITQLHDSDIYKINVNVTIDNNYTSPHIGGEILSMSKRIMNDVMILAQDLGINIYYQDTDSMHIEDDKINILSEAYYKLYKRELLGENLGQFHIDFSVDKKYGKIKAENIKSIMSVFCGKKAYCDLLEFKDNNNIIHHDYHSRLKGIPPNVLENKANTEYDGDMIMLYTDLIGGSVINFDLLDDNYRCQFNNKNYTFNEVENFERNVGFEYDINDPIILVDEKEEKIINDEYFFNEFIMFK